MPVDSNFAYFILQVSLQLLSIWIAIWLAVRFYVSGEQARFDQLRVDLQAIKGEIDKLRLASDGVVDRAMLYLTSHPEVEVIRALGRQDDRGSNENKGQIIEEITKLFRARLQQEGMETKPNDVKGSNQRLFEIVEQTTAVISKEVEEGAKLMRPIARKVLLFLDASAPATISQMRIDVLAKYPADLIAVSLQKLTELAVVKTSDAEALTGDEPRFELTAYGKQVAERLRAA